jgi:hypothetical protein
MQLIDLSFRDKHDFVFLLLIVIGLHDLSLINYTFVLLDRPVLLLFFSFYDFSCITQVYHVIVIIPWNIFRLFI